MSRQVRVIETSKTGSNPVGDTKSLKLPVVQASVMESSLNQLLLWAGEVVLDGHNATRYGGDVIRSFRSKETERIWQGEASRNLPRTIQRVARRKLRMLNNAQTLSDLRVPPSNRLERLKGDRKGQFSIRINQQWRVCFEWRDGDALRVEIVDYH